MQIDSASLYVCKVGVIYSRLLLDFNGDSYLIVANPARAQLNRVRSVNIFFRCHHSPLRIWSSETSSIVLSCVSPLILYTQAKSGDIFLFNPNFRVVGVQWARVDDDGETLSIFSF